MPKLNPNYRPEGDQYRATPLERPMPQDYDTPREWADAHHLWQAQQPDATAWQKVIGYYLPLTYDVASRMTAGDVERMYRDAPDTIEQRRSNRQQFAAHPRH